MNQPSRGNWTLVVAWCALFLSPLLAYLTLAFDGGNTFLFDDGLLYSFPMRVFLHDAFAHDFSPQWVPYSACGFSLLAEGQSGLCFPATQVIYRIFSAESGWLIEMMAGHVVGFFCCCLLLRHLGMSALATLFGASVYAFCASALIPVPSMMWCYALLPGVFWATARLMEGRPRASLSLLIVVTLVLLTGHPVMILYIGMVTFAFVACLAVHRGPSDGNLRSAGTRAMVLATLVALAVLLASPQLLPMLQQLPFSARTAQTPLSLRVLQGTLHADRSWIPLSLFPTPFDVTDWRYWSVGLRFPAYALFLVLVGVFFGTKGPRRWYFTSLALFVLLMAAGPHIGLWKLVHSLPVLRYFRFPFRWLFFLPLCVSVLAAFGLDRLLQSRNAVSTVSFRWILRSLLIAVVLVELVSVLRHREMFLPAALEALRGRPWLTGALWLSSAGMLLAAFLGTRHLAGRRPIVVGVSLTVLSLGATHAFYFHDPGVVRHLETVGFKSDRLPAAPQRYRIASGLDAYEVWISRTIDRHCRYTPNLSLLEGRLHTGHHCSFIPYWASDVSTWCQETLRGRQAREKILDLCSARWLVRPEGASAGRVPPPGESGNTMEESENPRAIPRAHLVCSSVFCGDDDELIGVLESSAFEPRQTVALLTEDKKFLDPPADSGTATDRAPLPPANIVVDRPDRIEIEIQPSAPRGSLLVLSDTYYPGWKVLVDGVEKNILRANYAFRGVSLPEGAKRVVFTFDPFVPDAVLALPTMILIGLGLALAPCFPRRDS